MGKKTSKMSEILQCKTQPEGYLCLQVQHSKQRKEDERRIKAQEKRSELQQKQHDKMVRHVLMPSASKSLKRKGRKSPVRQTAVLVPGTPSVPPPRIPPSCEVSTSPEPSGSSGLIDLTLEIPAPLQLLDLPTPTASEAKQRRKMMTSHSHESTPEPIEDQPDMDMEIVMVEDIDGDEVVIEFEAETDAEEDEDSDGKCDDNSDPRIPRPGIMASDFPTELPDNLDAVVRKRIQEVDAADDAVILSLLPPGSVIFDWSEDPLVFLGRREVFTGQPGPTFPIEDVARPADVFLKIWNDEILDLIVKETNLYAGKVLKSSELAKNSRLKKWQPITRDDLLVFLAVIMVQADAPLPVEMSYWHSPFFPTEMPNIKKIMTYNRFILIKKFLHFVSGPPDQSKSLDQRKIYKIQPVVDHLSRKFAELYMPEQDIALDESLLKWKGRLSFAQKIANKAAERGIKSYELCESRTGYLWSFKIYTGKGTVEQDHDKEPSGATARIVYDLARPLFHKGHTLIMDNYYNSPLLSRCLKQNGTDSMGTLRINRQYVPQPLKEINKTDLCFGEVCSSQCEDLTVLLWRDSSLVSMLSTYHPVEIGLVTKNNNAHYKPQVVLNYNQAMGGVDKKDKLLAAAPMERVRCRVWYKKLFRRLLNASILNSFVMYRHKAGHHNLRQRTFRQRLCLDLLQRYNINSTLPTPVVIRKWISLKGKNRRADQRPILENNHFPMTCPRRRCAWCAQHGREARIRLKCDVCLVPLCVPICFKEYHTKE